MYTTHLKFFETKKFVTYSIKFRTCLLVECTDAYIGGTLTEM